MGNNTQREKHRTMQVDTLPVLSLDAGAVPAASTKIPRPEGVWGNVFPHIYKCIGGGKD